jgi:hypothetical protein
MLQFLGLSNRHTQVSLYECVPDPSTPSSFNLEVIANWNSIYYPTSLGTFNDRIVTGDLQHSVAIVKIKEGKFISEARDYGVIRSTSVEALAEDSLITGTVSQLQRRSQGLTLKHIVDQSRPVHFLPE